MVSAIETEWNISLFSLQSYKPKASESTTKFLECLAAARYKLQEKAFKRLQNTIMIHCVDIAVKLEKENQTVIFSQIPHTLCPTMGCQRAWIHPIGKIIISER